MRPERIWVHPDFKRKLKQEAASKDLAVLDLTERLAQDDECMKNLFERKRRLPRFKI